MPSDHEQNGPERRASVLECARCCAAFRKHWILPRTATSPVLRFFWRGPGGPRFRARCAPFAAITLGSFLAARPPASIR
jgi:hypothetical protein